MITFCLLRSIWSRVPAQGSWLRESCSPVKVSALSGFFCAQEEADEETNKPQTQQVIQPLGYLHFIIIIQDINYSWTESIYTYLHTSRVYNKNTVSCLICKSALATSDERTYIKVCWLMTFVWKRADLFGGLKKAEPSRRAPGPQTRSTIDCPRFSVMLTHLSQSLPEGVSAPRADEDRFKQWSALVKCK